MDEGRDLTKERAGELYKLMHEAREEILRSSDVGRFMLSGTAVEILAKYERQSCPDDPGKDWFEVLEDEWALARVCLDEFIQAAKADLWGRRR